LGGVNICLAQPKYSAAYQQKKDDAFNALFSQITENGWLHFKDENPAQISPDELVKSMRPGSENMSGLYAAGSPQCLGQSVIGEFGKLKYPHRLKLLGINLLFARAIGQPGECNARLHHDVYRHLYGRGLQ
jgi:hypothetical protein